VFTDSPLAFSTVTEGTCANAVAEIKSATVKRNVLILLSTLVVNQGFTTAYNRAKVRNNIDFYKKIRCNTL
jgi:hypothetical protein